MLENLSDRNGRAVFELLEDGMKSLQIQTSFGEIMLRLTPQGFKLELALDEDQEWQVTTSDNFRKGLAVSTLDLLIAQKAPVQTLSDEELDQSAMVQVPVAVPQTVAATSNGTRQAATALPARPGSRQTKPAAPAVDVADDVDDY